MTPLQLKLGSSLLFDALGSAEKTLQANPGPHRAVPSFEIDSSVRFFARHLGRPDAVCSGRDPRGS